MAGPDGGKLHVRFGAAVEFEEAGAGAAVELGPSRFAGLKRAQHQEPVESEGRRRVDVVSEHGCVGNAGAMRHADEAAQIAAGAGTQSGDFKKAGGDGGAEEMRGVVGIERGITFAVEPLVKVVDLFVVARSKILGGNPGPLAGGGGGEREIAAGSACERW